MMTTEIRELLLLLAFQGLSVIQGGIIGYFIGKWVYQSREPQLENIR